jgi:hydrogenase-4 membrane subunit HyfE
MDWNAVTHLLYESLYLLAVFGGFLLFSLSHGRQAIINVICGLYLALLVSLQFPFWDTVVGFEDPKNVATAKLAVFFFFTLLATWLFYRVMPDEFRERRFESLGKKIMLAFAATVLVMAYSFNVLPVTEFLTPGSPIQSIFAPSEYFFWWLIAPLIVLFLVS